MIHADGLVDEAPGALDDPDTEGDGPTRDAGPGADDTAAKPRSCSRRDGRRVGRGPADALPATASLTAPRRRRPRWTRRRVVDAVRGHLPGPGIVRPRQWPDTDRDPWTCGDARDDRTGREPALSGHRPGRGAGTTPSGPAQPLPTLDDLLAARRPGAAGGPARARLAGRAPPPHSAGSRPGPGRAERRARMAAAAPCGARLDGPKTIVVINPKGGAHKTTATMLLAATFGLQRGGYTLAWDNNETRGHARVALVARRPHPHRGRPA